MLNRDEDILRAAEEWKKSGHGVALATVLRSAALAIGLGLIYSLVLESVVGGVAIFFEEANQVRRFLLGANSDAIANYFSGGGSTIPRFAFGAGSIIGSAEKSTCGGCG